MISFRHLKYAIFVIFHIVYYFFQASDSICISQRSFAIGICIAGLILMLCVVAAILCLLARRRTKSVSNPGSSIYSGPYTNTAYSHSSQIVLKQYQKIEFRDINIDITSPISLAIVVPQYCIEDMIENCHESLRKVFECSFKVPFFWLTVLIQVVAFS